MPLAWRRLLGLTASYRQQPAANAVQHQSVQAQLLSGATNHFICVIFFDYVCKLLKTLVLLCWDAMRMHRRTCILSKGQWCHSDVVVIFFRVKVSLRNGASGKETHFSLSVPWSQPSSCGIHCINTKVTQCLLLKMCTLCQNLAASWCCFMLILNRLFLIIVFCL